MKDKYSLVKKTILATTTGLGVMLSACGNQSVFSGNTGYNRVRNACAGVVDPSISLDEGVRGIVDTYATARDEGLSEGDARAFAGILCSEGTPFATAAECTSCNSAAISYAYGRN